MQRKKHLLGKLSFPLAELELMSKGVGKASAEMGGGVSFQR
jgi:hypothetical protein